MNGEWGYCRYCAFQEPVNTDGLLVLHDRAITAATYQCPGGGQEPTPQPGPEAKPLDVVSLRKSAMHLVSRKIRHDNWIRAKAVAMSMMGDPSGQRDVEE